MENLVAIQLAFLLLICTMIDYNWHSSVNQIVKQRERERDLKQSTEN